MIDEILIQKLIDGELSNHQIREILREADQVVEDDKADQTNPTQQKSSAWKQLAVAFAENQIIHRAFSDLDSAASSTVKAERSIAANEVTPVRQQSAKSTSSRRTVGMFALAASLLIGVSLLHQYLQVTDQADHSTVLASDDSTEPGVETVNPLLNFDRSTLLKLTPDHQLQSNQLPTSFSQKVSQQVPLFDAKRFDRRQLDGLRGNDLAARRAWVNEVMPASGVTDQLVADYEKAGLMVDQDIEFLSGRLDDGRAYMIPYRTVRFSSGQ